MEGLFFLICIIGIIIQINSISKLKKSEGSKYWNIFIEINIASLISTILAYRTFCNNDALDLGRAIICIFICGASFIGNIILLIIGLIIKKRIKDNDIKLNMNSILIGILIVLLSIIIFIFIPTLSNGRNVNLISNNVINYLNNKYGDNNFKIIEIENDYSYNGIVEKDHTGYKVTVSSTSLKEIFHVKIYSTNPKSNSIIDEFIEEYYNEKTNEYLSQKYGIEFHMHTEEILIPNTFGHIPTFDELLGYGAIRDIFIDVKSSSKYNNIKDKNEQISYLKELLLDLINYWKITKDINLQFQGRNNTSYYAYKIQISNNILKIIDVYSKEESKYDLINLKIDE